MKRRELLLADKVRGMNTGELAKTLDDKYLELMNLRFQFATNRLPNPNRLKEVKREIARIKTVMREREMWQQYEQEKSE
ncbi:MAG: 50S ribosomal protein L29 [Anaerolineae bacterium]|nr:50S ribosomal protein L29 [Anaerolineae bacterium]